MIFKQRVPDAIRDKLPATIELTVFGMLITCWWAFLGGLCRRQAAIHQDYAIRLYGIVIYCIPVYWLGLMLQMIFGIWLDMLPIAGRTGARVFASTFEKTGFYVLDTMLVQDFSAFLDVLPPGPALGDPRVDALGHFHPADPRQYARCAQVRLYSGCRSPGDPPFPGRIQARSSERFVPILTMMGLQVALLMAGAVLTETTFSWPGMGRLLLERIYLRDYPTIQGVIVIFALIVAVVSLVVDIVYALVDPRVRY